MKKLIYIFYFSIYLLSATEAHQLLKIPVVFQHYAEHQLEDADIIFLAYSNIHYVHGSPQCDKRNMQLPFKSSTDCVGCAGFGFVPLQTEIEINNISLLKKKNHIISNVFTHTSYLSNIWQPPQYS
ncbi:MAG: hypothetical protein WD135_00760 [Ferruginibacter sp.]